MNSDNGPSNLDDETVPQGNDDFQEPDTNTKSCSKRKILWKPSAEKETFPTVVVNYHYDLKRRSTGSIPKRREAWRQMIAAMHAKKLLSAEKEDDDSVYNLRKLYEVSKEELESCNTRSTQYETKIDKTAICSRCLNDGSRQSLKVQIYNVPTKEEAEAADKANIEDKTNCKKSANMTVFDSCKSDICCQLKAGKCKNNISRNSIKVEIFNLPPLQEVTTEEIKTPKVTQILHHEPEIIVISDDSVESIHKTKIEPKKSAHNDSAIVKDFQNLVEVAQNTSECCNISCKSTQEPENFAEIPTQTAFCSKVFHNCLQIPPSPSKLSSSKLTSSKYCASTLRQRQTELHRIRLQVEQKRLELLDLKLSRERDQREREKLLFEKGLNMKSFEFEQLTDEIDF